MKFVIILFSIAQFCANVLANENVQIAHQEVSLEQHLRVKRQQQNHAQINYRPLSHAPANIQHLLQSQQAREPIVNIPVGPPPKLGPAPGQQQHQQQQQPQLQQPAPIGYRPQVQYGSAPPAPNYNNIKVPQAVPQYNPGQNRQQQQAYPQYGGARGGYQQPQQQQQQQPNYKALYRPVQGPAQEPQIQYSKQLPPQLQQLIQQHRP